MAIFYGSDSACVSDIGLTDQQITDPFLLIGQRIARRLQTPRGALALIGDDPNFGWDVRQYVNKKLAPNDIATAQVQISNEVLKDEQVQSCDCQLAQGAGGALAINLSLVSSAGPFSLTLNVQQLTVALIFNFSGGT